MRFLVGFIAVVASLVGCVEADHEVDNSPDAGRTTSPSSPSRGAVVSDVSPREFRVYLETPPAVAGMDASDVGLAARRGIVAWDGYDGWRVTIAPKQGSATTYAEYVKEWGGDRVGVAFGSDIIQIGLGDSKCNGHWTPFSLATIENIAKHEMGHVIGREHSSNRNDIMYPDMPTEYGEPCEIYSGTESLAADYYIDFPVRANSAGTIYYEFAEGAGGKFDICFFEGTLDRGCTEYYYSLSDAWRVSPGDYTIRVECENWVDPCSLQYRISFA